MRWIEWKNDMGHGGRFLPAWDPPYMLRDFDPGALASAAETSKGVRMDGVDTLHVSFEPRHITLSGTILAVGTQQLPAQAVLDRSRQELARTFNPRHPGTLLWNNEAGVYRIRCRPVSAPAFQERIEWSQDFTVEFQADSPLWENNELQMMTLGKVTNMWVFPWSIPTVFSVFLNTGVINNETGEEIRPIIRISPSPLERLEIRNEASGQSLIITHAIDEGQRLIVDMANYLVTLVDGGTEINVTHWADGTFWGIVPGENHIRVITDTPAYTPETQIEWRVPLLGV